MNPGYNHPMRLFVQHLMTPEYVEQTRREIEARLADPAVAARRMERLAARGAAT